jgi:hypothetical protein
MASLASPAWVAWSPSTRPARACDAKSSSAASSGRLLPRTRR